MSRIGLISKDDLQESIETKMSQSVEEEDVSRGNIC